MTISIDRRALLKDTKLRNPESPYFDTELLKSRLLASDAPVMDLIPYSVFETPASSLKQAYIPKPEYQGIIDDYLTWATPEDESPVELPTGVSE